MTENEKVERMIEIANSGKNVKIRGLGNSMRPLLHGGRDEIYLQAITEDKPLCVGDVVLYCVDDVYKIHRIMKIVPEGYIIAGDGNQFLEPPLKREYIYLRAIGFQRADRYISVENTGYRIYAYLWRVLYPVRPVFRKTKAFINVLTGRERYS